MLWVEKCSQWRVSRRAAVVFFVFTLTARTAVALEIGPDAFGYRAADAPYVFEDISGSGVRVLARSSDEVASAPLGFTFNFYGADYSSVSWSTNALLTFGGSNGDFENVSLAAEAPAGDLPSIALLWDDWQFVQPGADATYYEMRETDGLRRFIVQWNLVFGSPSTPSNAVFQAVLFEGTNDILFSYMDTDTATPMSSGASATVGIRDASGHLSGMNLQWSFNSGVVFSRVAMRFVYPTDTDPPQVAVTSPADGAVIGTVQVSLTAQVTDESPSSVVSNPAGLAASLPAGGGSASGMIALVEGPNTIVISATDAAGNVGGASINLVRDMTPPALTVVSPAAGSILGEARVAVTLQVDDATATTVTLGSSMVRLPAGGGTQTVEMALSEGPNELVITVADGAGNSTTAVVAIMVDLGTPLVSIDSPADGAFFGADESPITVVATVNDASPTSVEILPLRLVSFLPAGGGFAVGAVALVEGPNTITVTAADPTGRMGSASVVVNFDSTPPLVSLDSPAVGMALHGTVEFAATALDPSPGSGIARVDFLVDGASIASIDSAPYEFLLDTTAYADGSRVLTAMAVDREGAFASASVRVRFDNTPPVVSFAAPAEGAVVAGFCPFMISASDGQSGVAMVQVLAGGTAPAVDPSRTFDPAAPAVTLEGEVDSSLHPDGNLTITALVVDAAGNQASAMVSVLADNTPPGSISITPVPGTTVSGKVNVTAEAADLGGGVLEIHVDGVLLATSRSSPLAVEIDTTLRPDGVMDLRAVARDAAGNESSASSSVLVDNVSVEMRVVPNVLNLKTSKGRAWMDHHRLVVAHLKGDGLDMLLPLRKHQVELRVPGGSPVRALSAWHKRRCRGKPDDAPERLHLRFDRKNLVSSIRAGIASGDIDPRQEVEVALFADGIRVATAYIRVVCR